MIGDNIAKRRKELGLTQSELIEKAQELIKNTQDNENKSTFTQARLSNWENNTKTPSMRNIMILSQMLNCSIEYLMGDKLKDNMNKNFYNEAVRITRDYSKVEGDCQGYSYLTLAPDIEVIKNISVPKIQLLEAIKKEKISEVIYWFLKIILICQKELNQELSCTIPEVYSGILSEDTFYKYMLCFCAGLNGSYYHTKIVEKMKEQPDND